MDRATAEKTMRVLTKLNAHISDMTELISEMPNLEEQKELRRPVGDLIGVINVSIMRPLVHAFPDLDPDKRTT